MDTTLDPNRDRVLLEQIEKNPDVSQASLATQLGVAVGTVNWHLKRLVSKGYIRVKRAQRRKLRYIITSEGIALRARLTIEYIDQSMKLYRQVRQGVRQALIEAKTNGVTGVRIKADGDIGDICRLTCLEQGISVMETDDYPILEVQGLTVLIRPQESMIEKAIG